MADAVEYHVLTPSGAKTDTHVHLIFHSSHPSQEAAEARAETLGRNGAENVHVCEVRINVLSICNPT